MSLRPYVLAPFCPCALMSAPLCPLPLCPAPLCPAPLCPAHFCLRPYVVDRLDLVVPVPSVYYTTLLKYTGNPSLIAAVD